MTASRRTDLRQRSRQSLSIDWHEGDREGLRELFELAEDSAQQLAHYFPLGRVLVASRGCTVVGHLQLVLNPADEAELELKNMAVRPVDQGMGVGRALVQEAVRQARAAGYARMVVATAAADIGNLRFYQRVGFRIRSVEPDAFTPATGYPDRTVIDGIQLRDRVWFVRTLITEQE